MYKDKVAFSINPCNGQRLNGSTLATHAARQFLAFDYPAAGAGMHRSHRTRLTMRFGTVFHRATAEIVELNGACKAFAAADTAYVNQISGCEYVGFDYVTRF